MIGPVALPVTTQASASVEPAQAPNVVQPVDDPKAGTAVETRRAVSPIPDDTGQRGIEGAIAAKQNQIYMTEAAADRDRERLMRYPAELAVLQEQLSRTSDGPGKSSLSEKIGKLNTALNATQARVTHHDANWPDQRAEIELQIEGYKTQLAQSGYGVL